MRLTAIDIWSYVNAFLCDGSDFSQFKIVITVLLWFGTFYYADADNGYFNIYQTMFFVLLKGKCFSKYSAFAEVNAICHFKLVLDDDLNLKISNI